MVVGFSTVFKSSFINSMSEPVSVPLTKDELTEVLLSSSSNNSDRMSNVELSGTLEFRSEPELKVDNSSTGSPPEPPVSNPDPEVPSAPDPSRA